jgi:hypothetical protein
MDQGSKDMRNWSKNVAIASQSGYTLQDSNIDEDSNMAAKRTLNNGLLGIMDEKKREMEAWKRSMAIQSQRGSLVPPTNVQPIQPVVDNRHNFNKGLLGLSAQTKKDMDSWKKEVGKTSQTTGMVHVNMAASNPLHVMNDNRVSFIPPTNAANAATRYLSN